LKLPEIDISVEAGDWPGETELRTIVAKAIEKSGETAGLKWPDRAELSLVFTDDREMAVINGQWRGIDKATNVLSFPGADIVPGGMADRVIGDLVFARETVIREAREQGKSFTDHLTHLVVHGFLHLFGYDHIEDQEAEEMEALERKILDRLGIADPYAYL
jgi:probable rRNA maturation factor